MKTNNSNIDKSNKINSSLKNTIINSSLKDLTYDLTELGIDLLIKNEFVKNLPFVKIGIGAIDTVLQLKSHFLTKKILKFLIEFNNLSDDELVDLVVRLDTDKKYSKDFGERLLLVIDSFDDYDKATILGKAFKRLGLREMTIDDFMRISHIINRAYLSDLNKLDNLDKCDGTIKESLYNLGLLSLKPKKIENGMSGLEVRKRLNQTDYEINNIGELMYKIIKN